MSSNIKGKDIADHQGPETSIGDKLESPINDHVHNNHDYNHRQRQPANPLSRYESQKRRDWNTFSQFLKNQRPTIEIMTECTHNHVLDFLRYLDQFGKTKVHQQDCAFFGQPQPPGPCTCPLRQAWGSLDALIGRLRAAYEENGGMPESNPFASGVLRMYLREVRDSQSKARGVPYKKKKKRKSQIKTVVGGVARGTTGAASSNTTTGTCSDGSSNFSMQPTC